MLHDIWEFFLDACFAFFVPLVCTYYACTTNIFLNTACNQASGLEKLGNDLLIPCHYLFVAQSAYQIDGDEWEFANRFDYSEQFVAKTIASSIAAIPSFVAGVTVKGLSFLGKESRVHHKILEDALSSTNIQLDKSWYQTVGINLGTPTETEWFLSEGHQRRPGDENNLRLEKEALREIAALFNESGIPWWVDCGTCLGTYRYGGVIPWDEDIDIAVLIHDFDNVKKTLNKLDSSKYIVQDWSSREHPKSYLKVFIRKTGKLIDIYNFRIDSEKREVSYVFALEHSWMFPDWWKERESRFTAPISYDAVFPLKKALFDGIEVFVARNTKKFLQRYYGENLDPAKIFNPATGQYERDLSHPYWQRAYVH